MVRVAMAIFTHATVSRCHRTNRLRSTRRRPITSAMRRCCRRKWASLT